MTKALADFDSAVEKGLPNEQIRVTARFYEEIYPVGAPYHSRDAKYGDRADTFLRSGSMSLHGRAENSSREMKSILKAIVARDAEAARAAASEHVKLAYKAMKEVSLVETARRAGSRLGHVI